MTAVTEKRIKVTKAEALEMVVRVIRHTLTEAGMDPSQATDEQIEGVWNQMHHDAQPGTYGAAWIETLDAWCDETQASARPVHRRVLREVRNGGSR